MRTVQGFIDFINDQDPDEEINHKGMWCHCAIGDYAGHIAADEFADTLKEDHQELYDVLNWAGADPESPDDHVRVPTYDHLQQWLKENPCVSEQ